MSFNGTNVIHLQVDDFIDGILTYNKKPVKGVWIVMVQGDYCGYCTKVKPIFAEMSKRMASNSAQRGPMFATIQIDGGDDERALSSRLPKIINTHLAGVPAFLKFEDGKFSAMIVGGKNENELIEFMSA